MKKNYLLWFTILSSIVCVAQTAPAPHILSAGNFEFYGFTSDESTIYPTSMQGWVFAGEPQSAINSDAIANRALVQNSTAFTIGSIRNEADLGISLLNSSTNNIGAIALALNTLDREQITVEWTAAEMGNPNPNGDRSNALVLQYRIGTSGVWVTLENTTYITNLSQSFGVTPPQNFSIQLPEDTHNQEIVQLRWLYYLNGGAGSRDRIRLDNISVSGQPLLSVMLVRNTGLEIIISNGSLIGKTSQGWIEEVKLYNVQGQELIHYTQIKSTTIDIPVNHLDQQVVFILVKDTFGSTYFFKKVLN
jgi:hypothetical protein